MQTQRLGLIKPRLPVSGVHRPRGAKVVNVGVRPLQDRVSTLDEWVICAAKMLPNHFPFKKVKCVHHIRLLAGSDSLAQL